MTAERVVANEMIVTPPDLVTDEDDSASPPLLGVDRDVIAYGPIEPPLPSALIHPSTAFAGDMACAEGNDTPTMPSLVPASAIAMSPSATEATCDVASAGPSVQWRFIPLSRATEHAYPMEDVAHAAPPPSASAPRAARTRTRTRRRANMTRAVSRCLLRRCEREEQRSTKVLSYLRRYFRVRKYM
eukprot:25178-Pelagococcus_subviridis.AAC.2